VAKKTYKRELAVTLLVWLAYVVEVKDVSIVEVLVWPIFAFVGAAFGFDAMAKQLHQNPIPPRRNSSSGEYSTGEDEYPDGRNYEK
jgi:hypothetical protein